MYIPRIEAKAKGVKFGRKRSVDRELLLSLRNNGFGATDIAKEMSIGRSTVYKLLKEEVLEDLIFIGLTTKSN